MSSGALMIARNNSEIDYLKQAVYNAKRIKKFLNIPVSLITDSPELIGKRYENVFDNVIPVDTDPKYSYKYYSDGTYTIKSLEFKNTDRVKAYELSPYDETLLLDTDFIISNSILKNCFDQNHNFLIYKDSVELSGWRDVSEFDTVSDVGPDFYWATVVFFRKSQTNKIFFELLKHIADNWPHYANLYQISTSTFRNDYVFSIAVHIMNGYIKNDFTRKLPGKLFYITDRDLLLDIEEDSFLLLIEKQDNSRNYTPMKITGSNLHVLNKFSLIRAIDNDT